MAVYKLWRDYVDDPAQQDDDVDDQICSLDQTGKLLEEFPLCSLPNASQGTLPPHRPLSIKLPPASTLGLEPSHGEKLIQFKVCIPTLSDLLIFSSFDSKSGIPLSINAMY